MSRQRKAGSSRIVAAVLISFASIAIQSFGPPAKAGVMMEGFYWDVPSPANGVQNSSTWWWDNLATKANQLGQAGFTAVWLPPVTKGWGGGYNAGVDSGYGIFDDYDLGDKNQLGSVPTRYGSRVQLERCAALLHANGIQVYADIVDSHRDGDDGFYNFHYLDAYGNANGGRFGKSASDFSPNVPVGSNTPDPYTTPDGRWIQPTTGGQTTINGQTWVWVDYGMKQACVWMTNALDLNGYRFDDVRASSWSWLYSFMNYSVMNGKVCVSENWDDNLGDLEYWVNTDMSARSSAFDFPLRDNYLAPMCNNPGSFNMASLDHAGLAGAYPFQAVTFVENHDTDNGGGSGPVANNKLLGYAYILTSEGYPCVFYRDWSTDPGCYGSGLQAGINNLVWIHEKIASGTTTQRWKNNQIFAYERLGGGHLLVGLNADTGSAHTITCATGFGANVTLHDYTGHSGDVTTDGSGNATITIPVNNAGKGYVAYSVYGFGGGFSPAQSSTTQEYDGAQDLDIKPADNTQFVQAAQVYVQSGKSISGALTFDTTSWTASTAITLQLLNPSGTVIGTKTYTSGTAQGSALAATASANGYYTYNIKSTNTPSGNLKPSYSLRVTYTAPQTLP
jgi:alpha-amylase